VLFRSVRRGSSVLLHTVMELAIAEERASGKRLAVAVRTAALTAGDDVRAIARIYLHDVDHLLEAGAGAVTFDVLLGAGDGRTESAVVATAIDQLTPLPATDQRPRGIVANLLARLLPRLTGQPITGVLHHLRWSTTLPWQQLPDGTQQAAPPPGDLLHEASSYEYSYEIVARFTVRGAQKELDRKIRKDHLFSWSGSLW